MQDTAGIGTAYNSFQFPPIVTVEKGTGGISRGIGRGIGPKARPFSKTEIDPRLGIGRFGGELRLIQSESVEVSVYNLVGGLVATQRVTAQAPMSIAGIPKGLVWIQSRGAAGTVTQAFLLR